MEAQAGNEFFDWEGPPNVFNLIEKNEDDEFSLKVAKMEAINHDSYELVLEFPNKDWIMGLWPSGHVFFHADIDGKRVTKKYTPVSPVN